MKQTQFFILDISVGIVHGAWSKHGKQNEIYTVAPIAQDGSRKSWISVSFLKDTLPIFWFIQKSKSPLVPL